MKSMLVIDGSQVLAKRYAGIFEKRGWNVTTCGDADCAMEQLGQTKPYDLILLGYRVQGTDGMQLLRFIRALEHLRTTAVVMVTGLGDVTKNEALAAGADHVLFKPVNPNVLVWAVDKHVS